MWAGNHCADAHPSSSVTTTCEMELAVVMSKLHVTLPWSFNVATSRFQRVFGAADPTAFKGSGDLKLRLLNYWL